MNQLRESLLVALVLFTVASPVKAQESTSNKQTSSRVDLVCAGAGSANKPTVTQGYGSTDISGTYRGLDGEYGRFNGSGSTTTTIYGERSQEFVDEVRLFVEGDGGRLRMPRTMLPILRGGENGWFKLKNVKYTDQEITASIAVNPLNNPKMRIDRYTGAISIFGKAGDYIGRCERAVSEKSEKQF